MVSSDPLLRALLDAIDTPLLLLDGRRVAAANRAAAEALGGIAEGRDIRLTLRHPDILALLETGRETATTVRGIGDVEREWRVELRLLDAARRLLLFSDLSAARTAERIRTDFVANASHELRTPLAAIIGYAETLAEDGPLPDELRQRFGGAIEREGRRMLGLVDDLMGLSRISAERFIPPSDAVDLAPLVRAVVDRQQAAAQAQRASLDFEADPDLPRVAADRGQIEQLIDNLVSNALRYGCRDDGGVVRVSLAPMGGMARLSVRDEGEGIAQAHLPRLTERFYRVDPARSRERGGTGLGLAIVKHVVERHRGVLHIRSRPGEGTEVIVDLPLVTKL